ncbi:unnamed protein product [Brassica oleracea var. botrytis]|uniref:FAD-binding FR-type domain-containing protein n=2 Tax=Brassica oleracea TaxID=3712 RepID=A0A0D3AWH3_BRAOL|nr:unnamed protein product [Brassica oleracea]
MSTLSLSPSITSTHAQFSHPSPPCLSCAASPSHAISASPVIYSRNNRVVSIVTAAAVLQDASLWTQLLSLIESAAESLFHISIEDYNSHDLVASYTRPGQYLQLRVPDVEKPLFLAIASPPSFTASRGAFEFFLVKSIVGSTAEILCGLKKGRLLSLAL